MIWIACSFLDYNGYNSVAFWCLSIQVSVLSITDLKITLSYFFMSNYKEISCLLFFSGAVKIYNQLLACSTTACTGGELEFCQIIPLYVYMYSGVPKLYNR